MKTTKKSTFKVLFYLKKNAPKKNGMVAIMCRITVNGKQSALSTKLDISASNWDLKYGRVLGKSHEAQGINNKIDRIRLDIEECYSKILKNEGAVNSDQLKNTFLGMESGELTFFKFFEQFLLDFEKKLNHSALKVQRFVLRGTESPSFFHSRMKFELSSFSFLL